jgi:hypothetical protein
MSNFDWDAPTSMEDLLNHVLQIQQFPDKLTRSLKLVNEQNRFNTYREGGWTITQIVHHLMDAHVNAYLRTKHILAQDTHEIQPWNENSWADQLDSEFPIESSVICLIGIHQRWSLLLLEALKQPVVHLVKQLYHPENQRNISLSDLIRLYAWHGEHHLAQIELALVNND